MSATNDTVALVVYPFYPERLSDPSLFPGKSIKTVWNTVWKYGYYITSVTLFWRADMIYESTLMSELALPDVVKLEEQLNTYK